MLSWRVRRQLAAIAVVAAIGMGIALRFGARLVPAPSCTDGRRNNHETGVDCGGGCAPCEVKSPQAPEVFWARFARAGQDSYDAVASIQNNNQILASSEISYLFTLFDELGAVAAKSGTAFIYPEERLYIIEPGVRTTRRPVRVEFKITHIVWRLPKESEVPPRILVERREYTVSDAAGKKQGMVQASIFNPTPFDFRTLEANAVVFDAVGNVLGADRISLERMASGEHRIVTFVWPEAFSSAVAKIEIYPRVNLFDPESIIKPQ